MNKITNFFANNWQAIVYTAVLIPAFWLLLFFKLGGPTNKASVNESSFIKASFSYKDLVNKPVQLPYRVLQATTAKLGHGHLSSYRAASSILAVVIIIAFYMLLRHWQTRRIAIVATILFATSAWFLHAARYATPDITYLLPIVTLASLSWFRYSLHPKVAFIIFCASVGALLYVPGMVWLVGLALITQLKQLKKDVASLPKWLVALSVFSTILLCLPLAVGLSHSSQSILAILGLPNKMSAYVSIYKNVLLVPVRLAIRGPLTPATWLGRLPLLNAFELSMVAFGIYVAVRAQKLDRSRVMLLGVLLFSLLASLGGQVPLLATMPFFVLLAASGIALLLQQWFTVFPRNPVARNIGLIIVFAACALSVSYNFASYFVAWHNSPDTKSQFQQKV